MHPITIATLLLVAMATVAQGGNSHFFQYANVPAWNAYEFGYNRGNQHHFTSRFEKAHGWTFKTKVRWGDKHGWGESYWDYNHGDEKKKGGEKKGWGHHHGSSSNLEEQAVLPRNDNFQSSEQLQGEPEQVQTIPRPPHRPRPLRPLHRSSAPHPPRNTNHVTNITPPIINLSYFLLLFLL
ncbi:uncharacterized protein LOC118438918 [Folsomia candida]|uniref:uncharacterized protein LOC118438918 n=1 Tax=Folsomia candida TaxID=158441 RepID=UPI00160538C5|nr:uncharacterized protein LOC118438918 [Folsomia candida]